MIAFLAAVAACSGDPDPGKDPTITDTGAGTPGTANDADGDGSPDDVDCDDTDPTVYPGAPDPCGDDRVWRCPAGARSPDSRSPAAGSTATAAGSR